MLLGVGVMWSDGEMWGTVGGKRCAGSWIPVCTEVRPPSSPEAKRNHKDRHKRGHREQSPAECRQQGIGIAKTYWVALAHE